MKQQRVYSCAVKNSFESTTTDSTITSINGTHLPNETNSDVLDFFVQGEIGDKIVEVFPSGLSDFFPNLKYITIKSCELQKIETENLKNFTSLVYLYLYNNKIRKLDRDLFKFNKNLNHLTFENNTIEYIDFSEFDALKELKTLNLYRNTCIREAAMGNRRKVLSLIKKVKMDCTKKMINYESELGNVEGSLNWNFDDYFNQFGILGNKLTAIKEISTDNEILEELEKF